MSCDIAVAGHLEVEAGGMRLHIGRHASVIELVTLPEDEPVTVEGRFRRTLPP
jgi:hypothetical protein